MDNVPVIVLEPRAVNRSIGITMGQIAIVIYLAQVEFPTETLKVLTGVLIQIMP